MTHKEQLEWIDSVAPVAQYTASRFGVPASVLLAHGILDHPSTRKTRTQAGAARPDGDADR